MSFNRNALFQEFLDHPIFDIMVMVDSDLGWEAGGLVKLIETEGPIVGGVYRYKDDNVGYPFWPTPKYGPVAEVDVVPGGFLKITREAAMQIAAKYKHPFRFLIENDIEYGEDVSFCMRAQRCGVPIKARMDIEFEHWGVTPWAGSAMTDLKIPAAGDYQ